MQDQRRIAEADARVLRTNDVNRENIRLKYINDPTHEGTFASGLKCVKETCKYILSK